MRAFSRTALGLFNLAGVISASSLPEAYHPVLLERSDSSPGPFLLSNAGQNDWMKSIPDTMSLTNITMPGTHDTMTAYLSNSSYNTNPFKTQLSPLPQQLNAGIRFIDIRCHHVKNKFAIWHTVADTGKTFTDVLRYLNDFLNANPSETILMRVHDENNYTGDKSTNTRTFGATYDWYQNQNPDTKDIFSNHQFQGPFNKWPTLGDARGKFLVLVDFKPDPNPTSKFGYPYGGGGLYDIEDAYEIKTDISEKWKVVDTHLKAVQKDSSKMWMTYCSATSANPGDLTAVEKFTPYHVAISYEAPAVGYDGINTQLWPTIPQRGFMGVVIFDFPGQHLTDSVIGKNFGGGVQRNATSEAPRAAGAASSFTVSLIPAMMVLFFY